MSGIQQALPPGFRFHPTDQELILHYLKNKVTACPLPACIVSEVDLYQHNPWDLPGKALFGEDEWYFFTPRDRKYPNGARPNRAAASGYWKATGIDRPIFTSCGTKSIGVKKALVFYNGRSPKGIKTDWIMHEYRLLDTMITWRRKGSMRLDDWVLCRVRQKNTVTRNISEDLTHMSESSYFQKATGLQSPVTEPNAQLIKESVNCPLLPYLLDTPNFSHFKRISSTCSRKYLLDEEEKQMFASSSQSMFDLSTGYSAEPCDLKSTSVGSSITSLQHCNSMSSLLNSDVSEGRSDPEKIHSSEDRYQGEMYEQFMPSSTISDAVNLLDIEQTQIFQNLIADQWTSIFQD